MTILTEAAEPVRHKSFTYLAKTALDVLYQHRVMSTAQLHQLLTPAAARPVYLLQQLNELRAAGLVHRMRAQGPAPGRTR